MEIRDLCIYLSALFNLHNNAILLAKGNDDLRAAREKQLQIRSGLGGR
jgi:hypothetical protein